MLPRRSWNYAQTVWLVGQGRWGVLQAYVDTFDGPVGA